MEEYPIVFFKEKTQLRLRYAYKSTKSEWENSSENVAECQEGFITVTDYFQKKSNEGIWNIWIGERYDSGQVMAVEMEWLSDEEEKELMQILIGMDCGIESS